ADFSSSAVGPITTQTLGVIADARWRPSRMFDLFARYETAQVDDPYVVEGEGLSQPPLPSRAITLTYRFIADSRVNDTYDARSIAYGNSATVSVTPIAGLAVLVAYTRRDLDD